MPSRWVSGITVTGANAAQLCFRGKDDGSRGHIKLLEKPSLSYASYTLLTYKFKARKPPDCNK